MTDEQPPGTEPVGSVAEETAKLLAALQDWAKETGGGHAGAATQAAGGLAATMGSIGEQIGHGPDCKFCPVCQVINVVRETSPEVRQHLAIAANSTLQALQGLLATQVPDSHRPARRDARVEKIDLDGADSEWDDD